MSGTQLSLLPSASLYAGSFCLYTPTYNFILGTAIIHDYLRRGILIAEYHHNVYPNALFVNPQTKIFLLFSYVSIQVPRRCLNALISTQRLRVARNRSRCLHCCVSEAMLHSPTPSAEATRQTGCPFGHCAASMHVVQPEAANPGQSTMRENTYEFYRPRRDFFAGQRPRKGH